jgi:hypothetical protein
MLLLAEFIAHERQKDRLREAELAQLRRLARGVLRKPARPSIDGRRSRR